MQDFQKITRRKGIRLRPVLLSALVAATVVAVAASAFAIGGAERPRVEAVPAAASQPSPGSTAVAGEPMNVLILGVDRRPDGDEEGLGTRSDTIMLAHVEPSTGTIDIVSVPRDLYLEVEPGRMDKVNAAYSYDGVEGVVGAIQGYGEIPIDHYAVVDFHAFRTVVNGMGGLEVDVPEGFAPEMDLGSGLQTLDGNKALMYARYRGTEGGDLDRIRRQQQVVAALRGKALRWESLAKLPQFAAVVAEKVETDMDAEEGAALAEAMLQNGDEATMTATQLVGDPQTLDDGTQVLVPDDDENERILAPFRY